MGVKSQGCCGGYEREGIEVLTVVLVVFGDFDEVQRAKLENRKERMCQ